ncbi:tail fiber domain-containing protein [bacterium]|nr:tail fiber domain-containing protein [bacterium]
MILRIYDDEFGGKLLFEEKQEVATGTEKSLFTFEKGEVTVQKRTSGLQAESLWVEVESEDQVMTPRLSLAEIGTVANLTGSSLSLREAGLRGVGDPTMIIDNNGVTLNSSASDSSITPNAATVFGVNSYSGSDSSFGGYFSAAGSVGKGVFGEASGSSGNGVFGKATGIYGQGVCGTATSTSSDISCGGYFVAESLSGRGVWGNVIADGNTVRNYGGYFTAAGGRGRGVYGEASSDIYTTNYGGYFTAAGVMGNGVFGEASGVDGIGVHGEATNTGNVVNFGGYFEAYGISGSGVSGRAGGTSGKGVHGSATNTGNVVNYGGYFEAYGIHGRGVYGEGKAYSFYGDGPVYITAAIDSNGIDAALKIYNNGQVMLLDGNEIDTDAPILHMNYNTHASLQLGQSGDGSVATANVWSNFSDIRLKDDIAPISNPLSLLEGINGVYYTWKDGVDQSRQVGVIAQEVEKVLPEVVSEDLEGYKSVDYGKITALLIEAVKELRSQNQSLYQQNQTLHKENQEIKRDIKILQNALRM